MTADIIDGKAFAAGLRSMVAKQTAQLKERHNLTPGLTVVIVGEDPASQIYVRNKGKAAEKAGTGRETAEKRRRQAPGRLEIAADHKIRGQLNTLLHRVRDLHVKGTDILKGAPGILNKGLRPLEGPDEDPSIAHHVMDTHLDIFFHRSGEGLLQPF